MKQSLQLRLSQHLTLTPQLQQSIKLLQLSTIELNEEIERVLMDNPLLEREEPIREVPVEALHAPATPADPEPAAAAPEESAWDGADIGTAGSGSGAGSDEEGREWTDFATVEQTLYEHLVEQLQCIRLPPRDLELAMLVAGHLDEGGYLNHDLGELLELARKSHEDVDEEELRFVLKLVQSLEPAGVGARSLSECLCLQLASLPEDTPHRELALTIARDHLEALAHRDFTRLKRALGADDDALRGAHKLIQGLNPRPGLAYGVSDTRYVVPDVIVRKTGNRWFAQLNQEAIPRLRINRVYADLLQKSRDNGAKNLSSQLQEARWLIKNVQQRFDTILRVTQAIVDRQRNFFDHGEVAMRPLILREIAEVVGLHESTISRVTTQKYMLTPRGLYELKYFFGSHVSTDTGGAASSTAIRALIKQFVAEEDPKRPLSDNTISDLLSKQGIMVARRTVAKYREALNIQPANLRKTL